MPRKLLLVFILLNFLFVLAGCGKDPYAIEREFWYLQKKAKSVYLNPDASPNRQVNKIVNALNNFAKRNPNTTLEISAEFSIASLYIAKKEFSMARQQLQNMLIKHKDSDLVSSEVLFFIGNSYELEDKWPQALSKYKDIINRYPTTKRGLEVPLYIAQYYKIKYQPDKMKEAFNDAADHFIGLSQTYRDKPLGFTAILLAAESKYAVKDYQGCINVFDSALNTYTDKDMRASAMMNKALMYFNGLKDKAKTKETLQRLINDYPKNKLAENARKFLKELEKK